MITSFILALCALAQEPAAQLPQKQTDVLLVTLDEQRVDTLAVVLRAAPGKPEIKWDAPKSLIDGGSLSAHAEITAPSDGAELPSWMLEASGFTVNGKPLGERGPGKLKLGSNGKITIDLDLGPAISAMKGLEHKGFKLGYGDETSGTQPIGVSYMQAVEKGLDFLKMPADDLAKYHVVLQTNRGDMEAEFWPDVAPKTVANFLDLCYTGFYNGTTFHRVIPGFMIQGGDPTGTGTGNGPRRLQAEFNAKKHVRGVLSMARTADPNSASCQFFVMHAPATNLDGQYSAFGKLVSGLEVVDLIVNSPRGANDKPKEPQTIVKAIVVRAPAK
jgi:peptidyl-prolyl cis-trans isomerase B (cyclophilin B)